MKLSDELLLIEGIFQYEMNNAPEKREVLAQDGVTRWYNRADVRALKEKIKVLLKEAQE